MSFNPSRLAIARRRKLLKQKDFAKALNVSTVTVSHWETAQAEPSLANIRAFSRLLGFPSDFFFGTDIDEPTVDQTSFRSQTSMTAGIRDASLAAGAIGFLICDWIEGRFSLPSPKIPDLQHFEPDVAARTLREEWGLGEKPVSNMIKLLESKGVRVFSLAQNTVEVNAYSLWRRSIPYIFLNNFKSAECSRFDAAHELGHLVLHQDCKMKGREAEDQANRFASSFLMPQADVLASIPRISHLGQLIEAKARWKVSLAALVHRTHRLGIISDWKNRDYCIEMGRRGYRSEEPRSIPRESSTVWKRVLNELWKEKTTQAEIAEQLNIPPQEIEGLLFGILQFPASESDIKPESIRIAREA